VHCHCCDCHTWRDFLVLINFTSECKRSYVVIPYAISLASVSLFRSLKWQPCFWPNEPIRLRSRAWSCKGTNSTWPIGDAVKNAATVTSFCSAFPVAWCCVAGAAKLFPRTVDGRITASSPLSSVFCARRRRYVLTPEGRIFRNAGNDRQARQTDPCWFV